MQVNISTEVYESLKDILEFLGDNETDYYDSTEADQANHIWPDVENVMEWMLVVKKNMGKDLSKHVLKLADK